MRIVKVICDNPNCKHEFEPQIKEKYLCAMISETYIKCPHCETKYLIKLDNTLTRRLQKNIEGIKQVLNRNLSQEMNKALNIALKGTSFNNFLKNLSSLCPASFDPISIFKYNHSYQIS